MNTCRNIPIGNADCVSLCIRLVMCGLSSIIRDRRLVTMLTKQDIESIKVQYVQMKLIVDEVEKTGVITRQMMARLSFWSEAWEVMDNEQCAEVKVINR